MWKAVRLGADRMGQLKDDTNASAIDPLSHLDRFVQFCSTKVLQPQIATLGRHRRDSQIDDPAVPTSMDPHSVLSQTCYQMPAPGQPPPPPGPPPPQSRSTNITWQPPPPLSTPNATRNTTGSMPPPHRTQRRNSAILNSSFHATFTKRFKVIMSICRMSSLFESSIDNQYAMQRDIKYVRFVSRSDRGHNRDI